MEILAHLVEALALQTAAGDSEVDKGDTRTQVRRELSLKNRRDSRPG